MDLPFLPDREYFTVREAARLAQLPTHTLRYWESRFGDLRSIVPQRRGVFRGFGLASQTAISL